MFAQEDISKELSLKHIPSTVYTPLEYSFCGLSEEQAIELYGEDQLNIYVKKYNTLEQKACFREGTEEGLGFIKVWRVSEEENGCRLLQRNLILMRLAPSQH